jgi:hypothetical protein
VGRLDQFAKQMFSEETPRATHDALAFEVPAETSLLTHVRADGLLRVQIASAVASLPLPWSLLDGHEQACVELKMQGDHLDVAMVQRALLRRQALEVLRADAEPTRVREEQISLWVVAATLPAWVRAAHAPTRLDAGVWRVATSPALVWVASNELELREDLIPFLITRTGRSLAAFMRWVVTRRPPRWVLDVLQILPMSPHPLSELLSVIPDSTDDPEIQERRDLIARTWLEVVSPKVKQQVLAEGLKAGLEKGLEKGLKAGLEKGLEKGLERGLAPLRHLFERKLGRPLTGAEGRCLQARLGELGPDQLGDLVLDLDRDALGDWLAQALEAMG